MPSDDFPMLVPGHIMRRLEAPFVYNINDDQLYELDDEAFEFLKKCNGRNSLSNLLINAGEDSRESYKYMMDEGIIQPGTGSREIIARNSPIPSLRYLLLNITNKCNLACRHCYLAGSGRAHITPVLFEKAISQFEDLGGLKLMISGGEPLLHPGFWELMEILPSYELRIVILSNGTLINKNAAMRLSNYVDEVQVSIDGINSHDLVRGKGSFDKAMRGISNLKSSGIPVSIATMVHKYNESEFEEMAELFSKMGVISWSVDVPCVTGSLLKNQDFILDKKDAGFFLRYGFGEGAHESTGNYTCGSHLCSVSPDGSVSKCGFFEDEPAGDVDDLRLAWSELCKKYLFTLDKLECRDCSLIQDCRGGCRFRAKQHKGMLAPDPVLCYANGVLEYL